ncbi:DUF1127 domain-containing protein [Thalassospira lucentensis]|uniref:DUF1127 domain-containing protein n=1 Tax=Thalassospira lucentensis TaxID=168935 RepID=UPI003D2F151E
MAILNPFECNRAVGCLSTKTSPDMIAQCLTTPASRPSKTKGVSAIIPVILDAVIASYKRYQSRVALTRLNDNQLRDIGLERSRDGFVYRDRL